MSNPTTPAPATICVLGFSRSGTSLTANLLEVLGVDLGPSDAMLSAHETDNARGYWEARWIIDLNERILQRLGTNWWSPFPGAPGWEQDPAFDDLLEEARERFEDQFGDAPLRGWKDPRTTLTLPFWRRVVPQLRYVVCLRNPIDAVASVQRRPEPTLSVVEWGELWLEYTARALDQTRNEERIVVFYEDFFRDDEHRQTKRLASFLGEPLRRGDRRLASARALVQRDLRHHHTSMRELAVDPGVPATARGAFLVLRAGHELRGTARDRQGEFANAAERLVPDLWWATREKRAASALAEERTTATTVLQERVDELREALLASERDRGAAEALAADARARLEASEGAWSERIVAAEREARHHVDVNRQAWAERAEEARRRIDELEEHLRRARAAESALRASPSWRLTAPLRGAKRMLTRAWLSRRER
jgi:hypothetical protein